MELSRDELLAELEHRERQIQDLKLELAQYRNFFHGRKIAVSAEVQPTGGERAVDKNGGQKDRR